MPDDTRVVLLNLPTGIDAATVCCNDYYTIVINARSGYNAQVESFWHEVEHIERGDFYSRTSHVKMLEPYLEKLR